MLTTNYLFLLALAAASMCSGCTQTPGYDDLGFVYRDMVTVFKTMDDEELKKLCVRLAPDEATLDYMRKHDLCYRGIPCEMDKQGIDAAEIGPQFERTLLRVRGRFANENLLEQLVHLDSTQYRSEIEVINGIEIRGTETNAYFKSGDFVISYLMGELLLINGKWSLFTRPNVDIHIRPI